MTTPATDVIAAVLDAHRGGTESNRWIAEWILDALAECGYLKEDA